MSTSDHDQLVHAAELQVQGIQSRAEKIVDDLKRYMPDHLKEMVNKIVSNTIDENPESVISLGDELKHLKKEISEKIAAFPKEVSTYLDTNVSWAHKKNIEKEKDIFLLKDKLIKETLNSLNDVGSLILGTVGSLFIKYKLAHIAANSYWKTGTGSSSVMFSYGLDFYHHSEKTDFQVAREKYNLIVGEYIEAVKRLETARGNKNKAEANKFWDEA